MTTARAANNRRDHQPGVSAPGGQGGGVCVLSSGSPEAALKVSAGAGVSSKALLNSRVLGRIYSS